MLILRGGNMKQLILLCMVLILAGCNNNNNNAPIYGSSGAPSNCRAIITENIRGWRSGQYSAEDALHSIDRNCGEHGYSWDK